MKIESIEFDKNENHIFGIKSAILWGNDGKCQTPLLYLSRPKHISKDDYKKIIDNIHISVSVKVNK